MSFFALRNTSAVVFKRNHLTVFKRSHLTVVLNPLCKQQGLVFCPAAKQNQIFHFLALAEGV